MFRLGNAKFVNLIFHVLFVINKWSVELQPF